MKRFVTYIFPLFLLAVVIGFFVKNPEALPQHRNSWLTLILPYFVLGFSGLLGWRFNKSMLAMLCVFLALLHLGLTRFFAFGATGADFRVLASLVTPLFFIWFYFGRERGMLNEHGVLRLFGMVFTALLIAFAVQFVDDFSSRLLPHWLLAPVAPHLWPVPRISCLLFVLCWLLMVFPTMKGDPFYGALLAGILMATFVAFAVISKDFIAWQVLRGDANRLLAGLCAASFTLSTAGIIALYAVLEISHGTAFVDQLTQLPGRRALDYRLATLGQKYSIAMVDIDFFKKVNDRHGHDVGDQALRFIAAKLAHVRGGRAYRYGGEEFAVIFPRQAINEVEPSLNALRESIHKAKLTLRENDRPASKLKGVKKRKKNAKPPKTLTLTVSIGVADSLGESSEPQDVIIDADKALYKAKKGGRNRVVPAYRRKLDVSRVVKKS